MSELYRDFLNTVCASLGFANRAEAINDFLMSDPKNARRLKILLSDAQSTTPESVAKDYGIRFHKYVVTDRRVFRVPMGRNATVFRKQPVSALPAHGSQKSMTEAETFVVIATSDGGVVASHRPSQQPDMIGGIGKSLSFRESIASSHGMTITTNSMDSDGGGGGGYSQTQYALVERNYPRECLFATELRTEEETDETLSYLYAIRSTPGPSSTRIMYGNEPMQILPTRVGITYLQGSMLDSAHRLFSVVYMRLLAYYKQREQAKSLAAEELELQQRKRGKSLTNKPTDGSVLDDNSLRSNTSDRKTGYIPTGTDEPGAIRERGVSSTERTDDVQRVRDEFSVTLFKFGTVLEETIHALQGVFDLDDPDFMPDDDYVIDPSRDYLMSPEIAKLLKIWDEQIDTVLVALDRPRPISSGPLEEVDYWRYRSKVLTAVTEALRSKKARWVTNAWSVLNPEMMPYNRGAEIKAQMLEAKDNSRFLLLVERHFKNVQFGPNFDAVTETIPAMVQSLRLIWTISRGYNKDERMGPLLQRIAWALCDRVICVLEVSQLFSQSIRTIIREVEAAIRMLTVFENTYLQERQRVEATSQDNRWEFDRKILFGEIHYIKRILTNIYDMAKCAEEFYHMFGPELKNITGDNKTLTEVLRLVDQLFTTLKSHELPSPFMAKNEKNWIKVKEEFDDNASMIDAKAKNFINDYFAHIRGPTSAFDLLEKFKSVKARAAISCLLKDKYRDVLRSYGNELFKVDLKFKESKEAPAVAHYLPPVAGSITWTRLILALVKMSILRFVQSQPDILEEDEGKAVKARYVNLAEELRKYERFRHRAWESEVNAMVSLRLSQPVLFKHTTSISFDQTAQSIHPPPTWWAGAKGDTGTILSPPNPPQAQLIRQFTAEQSAPPGAIRRNSSTLVARNHGSAVSWTSGQGERTSLGTSPQMPEGCLPVYEVNFDSKLWGVIQEAARMELLGLQLPEIGRFLGLRCSYYQNTVLQLQQMVDRYEAIRVQLDPLKVSLMEMGLKSLVNTIDRGVFYLNWDSLVVDEYLEFCDRKLKRAETHIKEIHRCFDILERIGSMISRVQMFKEVDGGGRLVSAKEYMDYAETRRETDMEELAGQISTLATSCLGKLEEALFDTNTCRRTEMYSIYRRFEVMILYKLLETILRNMWSFVNALGGRTPVFYIDVLLVNSDVVLYPVSADLYKWMTQTLRGCVESSRYFIRWKHGTCEPCPPVRSEGDDMFTFNFVQELERCPELREPDAAFNQRAQHLNKNVMEFLKRLARYSILWHQDKQNVVEKWLHIRPQGTRDFEMRVIYLRTRWQSLERLLGPKQIIYVGAIALRLSSFFLSVTTNLRDWTRIYMRYLYDSAETHYNAAVNMILVKRKVLSKRPTSLVQMKELLSVMAEIRGGSCEIMDDLLMKVSERLRIIKLYGDMIPEHMWNCTNILRRRWNAILSLSTEMAHNVAPFKAHFAIGIAEEIKLFRKQVRAFVDSYKTSGPGNESEDLDKGCASLAKFITDCELLEARRVDLLSSERLLDLPISTYPELKEMRMELQKLKPIYELYTEQKSARQDWACILWKDAKLNELVNSMKDYIARFRQRPRRMRALPAAKMLYNTLKDFQDSLLLIQNLKDDAMRDRHWQQLMDKTGISFDMDPLTFTLEGVFAMQLHRFATVISNVVTNAQREVLIEKSLEDIKNIWLEMKFSLTSYTKCNKEPCFILGAVDEPTQCMEDHMMSLQSIGASRHATPFLAIVRQWEKDLTIVSDTLDLWIAVQQKWMYLEAIFMGGDVAKQLPNEAKRFELIDKMFRKIMKQTQELQFIMKSCLTDKRLDTLKLMESELEMCQKALNDYLDAKRNAFPRFYFISDDEVLNILGGKEAEIIQEHIIKMFDNIGKLRFSYSSHSSDIFVSALISFEGECMEFVKPVLVFGKVEEWLTEMEAEMRRTNHKITKQAVFYYCHEKLRVDWMFDYQGMVVLAASQIWFTWEVEDVFRSFKQGNRSAMKEYDKKLEEQLSQMVHRIRTELTPNDMNKLETVLILDVHSKDMVERFIRDSLLTPEEFGWESQLRFYWVRKSDSLVLRQCSTEFNYGNEYFGLNGRLVITPLTDRIYLTITQALSLCLGGAPAGPAGTGKTESIKDLAKALGLLCVVTNCGENMDYKSFAKLLSGLCRAGAWGCFDEFNRIEVSVLSVVSSQIKSIQNALATKAAIFQFEGSELPLDRRVGVFITMNPGYAGRTELPESVKALFRPVVVIVPDLEYICEIMLFSQGFLTARDLAKKITVLYRLAKEQLSQQYHYDFGLRALRSLLVMAGVMRRRNPTLREDQLLMRALRDSNIPKLVHEDVPLFMGLIQDLFPGIEFEAAQLIPELAEATQIVLERLQYTRVEEQIMKVVQLHETLQFRHSVMIVGPTCGGKTVVADVYMRALKGMGIHTRFYSINPKDRSVNDLYGYLEPATREWIDGLLSYLFRIVNQPTEALERRFLIFDGDVDALWIENMNSVMDDNRLLTLVNGERIRLQPYSSLLFEVADLQFASPATVSRCGMVYVDPVNLGYAPYWHSWLSEVPSPINRILGALYHKYVPVLVDYLFDGFLPTALGRLLNAAMAATAADGTMGESKDADTKTIGGTGSKESSSGLPRVKLVLPLVRMNVISQLCTMLRSQLDVGSAPGSEKMKLEIAHNPDMLETTTRFSALDTSEAAVIAAQAETMEASSGLPTSPSPVPPTSPVPPNTLSQANSVGGMSRESVDEPSLDSPDVIEAVFIFCLCWTFNGIVSSADNRIVDALIKALASLPVADEGGDGNTVRPGQIPTHHPLLTDYLFSVEKLHWVSWKSLVPAYVHDTTIPFTRILVRTVDTLKLEWLMQEHLKLRHPLMVVGETGTSKTATIDSTMHGLDRDSNSTLVLNFSSRTTANDVGRMINANVEKRAKGVYGPIPGKKLVIFIDDMNMPREDEYGTQQPIALLRVIVGRGGLYQMGSDLSWRNLKDMTYVSAIGPAGGGRQSLDPRFVSLFTIYYVKNPSTEALFSIFGSVLSGHLSGGFSRKLRAYADKFTHLSLLIYNTIRTELLPTPLKFHYTFNLRELSKLLQGLLQASPERCRGPKKFLRLWRHECLRVFRDRMVDDFDTAVINTILIDNMNVAFSDEVTYAAMDPILFGDYWAAASDDDARLYEDMQDYEVCKAIVEELLFNYRETEGNMEMVLFNDALEHLGSIHRILRLDGGHALLVGVSGSGKKCLAKLAAYIAEVKTFEIVLRRGYTEVEFREDLKSLYTNMSSSPEDYMFLVCEEHIREESFLELINNMLTTGFVSALFSEDEKDTILENAWVAGEAAIRAEGVSSGNANVVVNKETVWNYFRANCASRLHIVLCMNPTGDALRMRCRDFPGIVKCTTADWYFAWPEQALYAVACSLIDPKFSQVPTAHWEAVVTNVVNVHKSVQAASLEFKRQLRRINHVTATNYILFINGFLKWLEFKTNENIGQQKRLQGGLEKLHDTAIQIDELDIKLAVQRVVLEEKTTSCEKLMEEINEATIVATAKKTQAQEKSVELGKQAKVIVVEKADAEAALAEAMPAVEAALQALDELEKSDVTEIRAFATPPKAVQLVGECLCHVMQASEATWKAARGLMADANFINTLQQLDVEAIPVKNIQNLKDLIAKRKMNYEDVRSASKAGGGFYKYITSVITFHDAAREVRPKRERVKALEREFSKAKRDLQRLTDEVTQLEETLFNFRRQFNAAQVEMENLKKEMDVMLRQLMAAQKLTEGLGSEKIRWIREVSELEKEQKCWLGNSLIASGFLCYLGPFTTEFRERLLYKEWLVLIMQDGIPISDELRVNKLLANEVEIALWNSQGLPSDELSIQNAILTTKGPTCPVCIDPQGQASRWIKEMEKNLKDESRSIRITTQNDPNFLRILENSIKLGLPCIIEGVEESLDPAMNNIVARNIRTDHGREIVMLGDREVDYDPNFRLYLVTKLSNPHFSATLYSRALIINYSVTLTGLEGQLLSALIKHEHKELEERREALILETSENKRILKELEDRLLLELSTQTGNILDNWELIGTLEDTKNKAVDVSRQLTQAAIVAKDVDRQRDSFRPAARRGAILFFVLADLAMVGPMYQFSLASYLTVFIKALKKAMPHSSLPKRLSNIKNALTYATYCYGCMAIFDEHKLLLSFELTLRLQMDDKLIRPKELAFLIRGNVAIAEYSHQPPADWISEAIWRDVVYLAAFLPRRFGKLPVDLRNLHPQWKKWYESKSPETMTIPGRYAKLKPFSRLCLLRCWRMDRIPTAITIYVTKVLGKQYIEPPITNLADVLSSTGPTIPIVLIVQPGSDPQSQLSNLAQQLELGQSRIKYLSMGQGQEPHAENLFIQCAARGNWLLLQNCHLLIRFVPTLDKMIDDLVKPHPDFRLWMTTEMVYNFPIGMLQRSYKVVMEPPSGLKQNLGNSLNKLSHEQYTNCAHPNYRPCMFTLVFLHAVLQERRRYGKLGWNVNYDFSESDFQVSLRILQISLDKSEETKGEISWDTIKYLIGEVMYGGRTIDFYDRRVLTTFMDEYFGDFLFDDFQPFRFYQDDRVEYFIPEEPPDSGNYKEIYTDYVSHLPGAHKPEVLGLHPNASIGYSVRFARNLWISLLMLHTETEVVGGVPTPQRLSQVAAPPRSDGTTPRSSVAGGLTMRNSQKSVNMEATTDPDAQTNMDIRPPSFRRSTLTDTQNMITRSSDPSAALDMTESNELGESSRQRRSDSTSSSSSTLSDSHVSLSSALADGGADGPTVAPPAAPDAGEREVMIGRLADSLLARLPSLFDVEGLRKKHLGTEISPTIVVLMQELDRFNIILRKIFSSLRDLKKALAGKIGMSEELDDISRCLANGMLPRSWRRLVMQTEKSLPDWIQHMLRRADQYKKWMSTGKSEPAIMWLSGLHLPQSYLTALIQKACRKHDWALDKCALQTIVTNIVPEEVHTVLMAPELGCQVCGLYLEGSGWNVEHGYLERQTPRQLLQEMPLVKLVPIERHRLKLTNTVPIPVYITSQRRNAMSQGFVVALDIPTADHLSHWVLQGAALLLNTD